MSTSINDRIKELIKTKANGKNTVFAERLGVSEANIRSYTRGVMPKADTLEKIVTTYDINPMWLLTGVGEMMKSDLLNDQPSVVSTIHARQSEVSVTQTNGACQSELVAHLKSLLEEKERTIQVQQQLIDALRKP